ncbi:Asp23/Gls24 family envelope stress response protein [Kribbella sandramycini]|uniref:Asp23/Gls24 family envelope stress response protein n=1 Tax=Kribbella sandramycini TaxID=60450 RepID=A0A7Y4NZK5_9ACTN|nr:Asp23/Gls24 family envelope stress response protein [Kribbella sandramycini]MBB6569926.1 putative alkaline shock family protein YloU [Kribbella sandramycini]NOL40250.1 Asp23/Gls24 family envelope stress response protein [Kribbella sandramycini]
MSTDAVAQIGAADAAAQAARSVAGVVRLQPGLKGLIKQFAAQAWTRTTGRDVPDIAGVDVALTELQVDAEVRIVVTIDHHAADVGRKVHDAVAAALENTTGRPAVVRVRIVGFELEPRYT